MPLYRPDNPDAPVLSQFSLKGKVAAVTGGARGIGLEIVRGLAEAGADVAIIYSTSSAPALAAAREIAAAAGVKVAAYQGDVRSRAAIARTLDQVVADFGGRLDVVVANAGVCADVPSLEYTEETWQQNSAVNYDGVMWTAQAAGRVFKEQGRGNLIITASVSATLVNVPQRQAAYNAAKAAVVQLAKVLAVEWVDFARVNCVSPGFVETDMLYNQPKERMEQWLSLIPGRRMAATSELKGIYVFLASDACCYMTGANLIVDGGYTLL
ncbi:oxidoreductase, short chain dehydrogenase/reductase family [Cordyceps fumosorosea ARSEF 2679]|uniref:Oxidoreductase, short chain dehydrogenase/reductase family n=1 Tax=Cordyceps fumosorosea (strain ARSEF 2679) TaxID=1081104 RepID=A0A167RK46_CORFA|nr:oxidoreductase, short chain dehydrogenase/reductase family [Cordyceps fumosorosea ARSEF 2679]OAA58672.1 oxidoreductase, short chain dehydrogenase/reductase family [Cordyceps fumosorosea ARSEF 2679]